MFLELYYEHYRENCRGAYWEEFVSLPYAIRIPDKTDRIAFAGMLDNDGFRCVNPVNVYFVMYVNFTLRRYGSCEKACASTSINRELLSKDQFLTDIYKRYMEDAAYREMLCNNYAESASIEIDSCKKDLQLNTERGSANEKYKEHVKDCITRCTKQLAEANGASSDSKNMVSFRS